MGRTYSAIAVALATGVQRKWLDNLLSRYQLSGVTRSRQGVERRITAGALLTIEAIRILNLELGISVERAVAVAGASVNQLASNQQMIYATPSGLELTFPVVEIERRLRERMMAALESMAHSPRGRPPRAGRAA
jgi:hypothetical protein